jgi:hypothetical protein
MKNNQLLVQENLKKMKYSQKLMKMKNGLPFKNSILCFILKNKDKYRLEKPKEKD